MTQSSNIPDSISFEALEQLHAEAPCDNATKPSDTGIGPENLSQEDIEDIVHCCLVTMQEKTGTPVSHKAALHMIVTQMFVWHSKMHDICLREDSAEQALDWARDAGKFQAIMNILDTISVAGDDFTCPQN